MNFSSEFFKLPRHRYDNISQERRFSTYQKDLRFLRPKNSWQLQEKKSLVPFTSTESSKVLSLREFQSKRNKWKTVSLMSRE